MTRREASLLAATALAAPAQKRASATIEDEELRLAREQLERSRATLEAQEIPQALEPAVIFRP